MKLFLIGHQEGNYQQKEETTFLKAGVFTEKIRLGMRQRQWICIFIFVQVWASCTNQKVKNDWFVSHLNGKVRSVSILNFTAVERFGSVEEGRVTGTEIIKYDNKGFVVENERLISRNIYKYNYNKNDLPIEKSIYSGDSTLVSKEVYTYDKNNNRTEASVYGTDGKLYVKNVLKYDGEGNMSEENNYDAQGTLLSRYTYKYNSDGYPVEYNGYRATGGLMSRFIYRYDQSKNLIQENQFVLNGDDSTFAGSTITYQYPQVDEKGNWLKQIVINDGRIPTTVRIRDVEYY